MSKFKLLDLSARMARAVARASSRIPTSALRMSSTIKKTAPSFDSCTTEGSKPNQDYFSCQTITNPSIIENPKEAARKAIEAASLSLASDKKFSNSGTTLTTTIIVNNNIAVASIGDSAAFLILKDVNGGELSIKLTQEHSFSDPEIAETFKKELAADGRAKKRLNGLSVPCLGHNYDPRIAKTSPRIRLFDLNKILEASGLDLEYYKVFVASDGIFEVDLSCIGSQAPRASIEVFDKGKSLAYKHNPTPGNISAANSAKEIVEQARENGSQDNATVAMAKFNTEKNPDEATVLMVADGNGVNGGEAAKTAIEAAKTALHSPSINPKPNDEKHLTSRELER